VLGDDRVGGPVERGTTDPPAYAAHETVRGVAGDGIVFEGQGSAVVDAAAGADLRVAASAVGGVPVNGAIREARRPGVVEGPALVGGVPIEGAVRHGRRPRRVVGDAAAVTVGAIPGDGVAVQGQAPRRRDEDAAAGGKTGVAPGNGQAGDGDGG